ncbi:MAG: hypothetical protein JWP89_2833 [Schlesneria sp.]|nr:hypothetical protein [Schlesneria sp.]
MTLANLRLAWRLAKQQIGCWIATLLFVIAMGCFALSTPPMPWPRIAMILACCLPSLAFSWFVCLRRALRIDMQKQ